MAARKDTAAKAGGLRALTARRVAAARVASRVPAAPEEAENRLRLLAARLSAVIDKDLQRLVLAQLPALPGPSAYGTIQRGLEEAERRALAALERAAPTVRGAVSKTLALAKREYTRLAGKPPRALDRGVGDLAVSTITDDLRRAIRDQFADLRATAHAALSSQQDPQKALTQRLFVVPNRGNAIARTQVYALYNAAVDASGEGEWAVWVTRADERVRPEHARRHLRRFRVAEGLGGIWPGQEINCRCQSVPEEFIRPAAKGRKSR
jgi:hypothetical protein